MEASTRRAYLELHLAIFLWGFTAILGKAISLEELTLVWWRLLLTCGSLLLFPVVWRSLRQYGWRLILELAGIGTVIALHWVLFFGSVKYANVSICLVCMATASLFGSLLEPLLLRTGFRKVDTLAALLVVPGMALVVEFIPTEKMIGVYMGLASAFLAALFSVLNKKMLVRKPDLHALPMTFVELSGGLLFLSLLLPAYPSSQGAAFWPSGWADISYLLILAWVCTTLGYVLGLRALRHLSAFASMLAVNLEPVYGIVLAWLIFQEHQEVGAYFYFGVAVILLIVFLHPLVARRQTG